MQRRCTDLLITKTTSNGRGLLKVLGFFGGSPHSWRAVTFPHDHGKGVIGLRKLWRVWPWRHEEAGLCTLPTPIPVLQPCGKYQFRPFAVLQPDLSSISSPLLLLRNITVVTSLLISAAFHAFLLCVRHWAWAGETQMGRPVQGAGCLGGGFLSEQYLQRHFFPCCVGPSPARWPGCYISTLSSGHPASRASSPSLAGAVVLSGDL